MDLEEGKIRFKVAWFNMAYQFRLGTGFTEIASPRQVENIIKWLSLDGIGFTHVVSL